MTVGELKKELEGINESLIVLMPRDAEGNGYNLACTPSLSYCREIEEDKNAWHIEEVIGEDCFEDYEEYGLEEKPKANSITL